MGVAGFICKVLANSPHERWHKENQSPLPWFFPGAPEGFCFVLRMAWRGQSPTGLTSEEGYVAQVRLSCPGVCVRHWFGVGAFAWCEYFLGSCVFFPGVGVLLSRLESCTAVTSTTNDWTCSGSASPVRRDPLAQCGHTGCGVRWFFFGGRA